MIKIPLTQELTKALTPSEMRTCLDSKGNLDLSKLSPERRSELTSITHISEKRVEPVDLTPALINELGPDLSRYLNADGKLDLDLLDPVTRARLEQKGLVDSSGTSVIPLTPSVVAVLGADLSRVMNEKGEVDLTKLSADEMQKLQSLGLISKTPTHIPVTPEAIAALGAAAAGLITSQGIDISRLSSDQKKKLTALGLLLTTEDEGIFEQPILVPATSELLKELGSEIANCMTSNGQIDLSKISQGMKERLEKLGLIPTVSSFEVFEDSNSTGHFMRVGETEFSADGSLNKRQGDFSFISPAPVSSGVPLSTEILNELGDNWQKYVGADGKLDLSKLDSETRSRLESLGLIEPSTQIVPQTADLV